MSDQKAEKRKKNPEAETSKEKVAAIPTENREGTEEGPKKVKRSKKRTVAQGNIHIQASYNNTIVSFTDPDGNVLAWSSSGGSGFKGTRKSTPYAAQVAAESATEKAKTYGFERAHVYVKGIGAGREQAVRALISAGVELLSITDKTPIAHNGCRVKKRRRV